jgi:GNAT superfamily N-acetyltransferase
MTRATILTAMSPPDVLEPDTVVIRRLEERDWEHLRSVRLAALGQAPEAFGSTLASEHETTEDQWREWIRRWPTFVAFHQSRPVAMVAGAPGEQPGERKLVAAWVHPDHRGNGIATALVERVEEWARSDGADTLTLWVARNNAAAAGLYERRRFEPTGRCRPLPSDPRIMEDQLVLVLG